MTTYQARTIQFQETLTVDDWSIKVYFINDADDILTHAYTNAQKVLPEWLRLENSFNADHDSLGFLIIHRGNEGIFYLINWWVGNNMLHSHVFFTSKKTPTTFQQISGDGLMACIWELEVINYERLSWTRHVLVPTKPRFDHYLKDQLNGAF